MPALAANTSRCWSYTGISLLANQYLNRTDKPVLGSVELSQRTRYYSRTDGYRLGTGNRYWRMHWHNTGTITICQYWLSIPVGTGLIRAFHYWLNSTRTVLTSRYWARSDFHDGHGTTPVLSDTGSVLAISTAPVLAEYGDGNTSLVLTCQCNPSIA